MFALLLTPLLVFLPVGSASADETESEPIPYLERYQPSFFLLGKPRTKVQISFKVQAIDQIPFYFGYTQLMMWELFHESAPFRDINYTPEVFYRVVFDGSRPTYVDFSPFEHESNGKGGVESRAWHRTYVRVFRSRESSTGPLDRRVSWSAKLWLPYGMEDPESKKIPRYRGLWEIQLSVSELFGNLFAVSELTFRLYSGGRSRVNPLQGGQELTYREKGSTRKFLLPFYFQIFHGYGENLLDAADRHWGFRAGVGF